MGKLLGTLATIATTEVKKTGVFTIPGVCRIKTRVKPATKAGKREIFGKMQIVKAKPARTIVKAFPGGCLESQHLIDMAFSRRHLSIRSLWDSRGSNIGPIV